MPPSINIDETTKTRVLVVDDNQPSAMTLKWGLETQGYDVVTCFDGPSAISLAESFQPQVILLDIGMPVMNGLEVCRRIRAHPKLRATTIYAQTGWGDQAIRQKTRDAGFDHHMTKPIDLDALLSLIEDSEQRLH